MKKFKTFMGVMMCFTLLFSSMHFSILGAVGDSQRQKIQEIQKENNDLEKKKADAQTELNSIDEQISQLGDKLIETNQKLASTKKEIEINKKELEAAKEDEKEQYASMKLRIQYMYENGDTQMLDLILNSTDITDFLNKAEYITELATYDREMLDKLSNTRKKIANTEKKLEEEKASLETLQTEQNNSVTELNSLSTKKQAEIDSYSGALAQNHINEDELEKELQQVLQQEEQRKQEEERQKKEEEAKKNEAEKNTPTSVPSTEPATTPTSPEKPAGGNGSFTWPLPASHNISSDWGDTEGRGSGHTGIDITAPVGTPIVAAGSGTVVWAYNSASAGMYVGIDHGNGVVSEYMHMSNFLVSAGDHVSAGQTIGYVGMTGQTSGPHLHFGVQLNGVRVNPWNYL